MELIFEKSKEGRTCSILPPLDVDEYIPSDKNIRKSICDLPQISENDLSRHFTELAERTFGINDGFYPLGSCTMKYNPKINEIAAGQKGFTNIHPLQPDETVQGCLQVYRLAERFLGEITGMDHFSFQPAAGAHGEFTGLLLMKAYHEKKGNFHKKKIIVPDSAHGTNPASAAMAGFQVITVPSGSDGCVDMAKFKEALNDEVAGLMLTNPNTLGIFDKNILEITELIHEIDGLNYYDGANLNAIMGIARPGDMGFDIVHLNLHKTFSTPHGGGGPGSGPVGCKEFLAGFLPGPVVKQGEILHLEEPSESIGRVKSFHGHFLVVVRALTYILSLGKEGIEQVSRQAVLNANYMMEQLRGTYDVACDGRCMHEFVMSLEKLKKETGVSALDVAKNILDHRMYPPTMYFPLIVHEALMMEPTETESKETMDKAIGVLKQIALMAGTNPEELQKAPLTTPIGRVDEVTAARHPIVKFCDC